MRPHQLDAVLSFIDQSLDQSLVVEDIARQAGLSQFHFSRAFKRRTGQSPHAYLRSKRMEVAKVLLADTATPIAEVANRVGYRTQAHFTSVFKLHVGMTPGGYRRSAQLGRFEDATAPQAVAQE